VTAVEQALGVGLQELHRKMDAAKIPAVYRQVSGLGGAGADDNRIVFLAQVINRVVLADFDIRSKLDTLVGE